MKDTTAEIDKTIDANQNIGSITVAKVKKAHSAYVAADRQSFYQTLLELNGSSSTEAAATASAAAAAYAEIMARLLKAPVPLYVLPSVISLVPGGSLYYTMSYCMERDWEQFGIYGYRTVQYALAIAAGMSLVWALADMWKRGIEKGKQKRWEERI